MNIWRKIAKGFVLVNMAMSYLLDRLWAFFWKPLMKYHGKKIVIRPRSSLIRGIENLSMDDYSILPSTSTVYCTVAPLFIGKKCIFGPGCTFITGDHRTDVVGKYIFDCDEKLPQNDLPIHIEDGVWCGANVTILKGVTIGRHCIVAAGSVVTKSFPPYCIIGGVPARLIKMRFSEHQIIEHESLLSQENNHQ